MSSFISSITEGFVLALKPIRDYLSYSGRFSLFLKQHGWEIDLVNDAVLDQIKNDFHFNELNDIVELFSNQISSDNPLTDEEYIESLNHLKNVMKNLQSLSVAGNYAIPPLNNQIFWDEFPKEVLDEMIIDYLKSHKPNLYRLSRLLGFFSIESRDMTGIPNRVNYTRQVIHWNRLKDILKPEKILKDSLQLDTISNNHEDSLHLIKFLIDDLTDLSGYVENPEPLILDNYYSNTNSTRDEIKKLSYPILSSEDEENSLDLSFQLFPIPNNSGDGPPVGFALGMSMKGIPTQIDVGNFTLQINGIIGSDQRAYLEFRPDGLEVNNDSNLEEQKAEISYRHQSEEPLILFGHKDSHRIQITDPTFNAIIEKKQNQYEIIFSINALQLALVFDNSKSDRFLKEAFGDGAKSFEINNFGLEWSSKRGLRFNGRLGINFSFPVNLDLGIAKISYVNLEIDAYDNGLGIVIGFTGTFTIGPITFFIDNMGLRLILEKKPDGDNSGIFGSFDLEPSIKWPDGIGASIITSGIKGTGIFIKTDNGYETAIDLQFSKFGIQAIALIETDPLSIMAGISVTVNIPLAGGWRITRLGGIIGIHKALTLDQIAARIKSGSVQRILFSETLHEEPKPVFEEYKNLARSQQGQHFIAPAMRVEYGVPSLLKGDIAIIFEFPDPITISILGRISAELPEDKPIVHLNFGFVGQIHFENKEMGFFGSLYDSKLLDMPLTGDIAMSSTWGNQKSFILTCGGFCSCFDDVPPNFPPFGLPEVQRLQARFSSHVSLKLYLAITSGTFQTGARIDARFEKAGARITGHISFDVFIQWNPELYYLFRFSAGFSARYRGHSIASLSFRGIIEGPNQHHLTGRAKIEIRFLPDVSFNVDKKYGSKKSPPLLEKDPWEMLSPELDREQNWNTALPSWAQLGIILSESAKELKLLHPVGDVVFDQTAVPLWHNISLVVSATPINHYRFELEPASENFTCTRTQDYFAPGHWKKLSNEQKATSKSYDLMYSGIQCKGNVSSLPINGKSHKNIYWETKIIRKQQRTGFVFVNYVLPIEAFSFYATQGSAYDTYYQNNVVSRNSVSPKVEAAINIIKDTFVIVDEDLNPVIINDSFEMTKLNPETDAEQLDTTSQAIARDKVDQYFQHHPEDTRALRVINSFELGGAVA